ncbi:hypothetical protein VOI32_28715 [Paraburkholderia caribensis]|uniref:Uncharacterized protein n=1 Tax=Paraburkholderia caribensis TaxID=75105 RepID=A0A9Q6S6N2_9BURK|nr:hypothetical protein [Paraburkholderia caribensis]MCO4880516.1 hypothetical protein [Paraburkholderia caribensis]PTB23788.1 hypothetical protein C9I56_37450 [Paraburkholderia caribensis]QLB65503.1 hypothetical protein A9O66_24310 [Paraburkholderia caribensis]
MTGHTDTFTPAECRAVDTIVCLHDALREAAGTRRHFRAGSQGEMQDYIATLARCMDTVEADPRLLTELGRRQLVKLNLCGPVGGLDEAALLEFYREPDNLRGAGLAVLRECGVTLRSWQDGCDDLIASRRTPPN